MTRVGHRGFILRLLLLLLLNRRQIDLLEAETSESRAHAFNAEWRKLAEDWATDTPKKFLTTLKPLSILGLLATVVLLFGFQAETILAKPVAIVLIAIPLLIQTYGIFAVAYGAAKYLRLPHNIAPPA